jgi:hypothetical protein
MSSKCSKSLQELCFGTLIGSMAGLTVLFKIDLTPGAWGQQFDTLERTIARGCASIAAEPPREYGREHKIPSMLICGIFKNLVGFVTKVSMSHMWFSLV